MGEVRRRKIQSDNVISMKTSCCIKLGGRRHGNVIGRLECDDTDQHLENEKHMSSRLPFVCVVLTLSLGAIVPSSAPPLLPAEESLTQSITSPSPSPSLNSPDERVTLPVLLPRWGSCEQV